MPTNYNIDVYDGGIGSGVGWYNNDPVTAETYTIVDQDDDGQLEVGDTINGEVILNLYDNAIMNMTGQGNVTGVFVQTGLRSMFIPTDGTTPIDTTFANLVSWDGSDFSGTIADMCFAAGTLIATPMGEVAVEDLTIGDLVLTATGKPVAVKWLGYQTVMSMFRPSDRLALVRITKDTLGAGVPSTDLTVTADHAILVEGVLCHAGALVNGTSIAALPRSELGASYRIYHIETESHEIILANGAPAETFIDNVSRRAFDNYAEFEALYGDVPEMEELTYPRAMSARQVPESIRSRFAARKIA
jgi:hypothetical protein